uniref:hypothetical protein n=1 Tax=Streptomyces johnsoniae TaxID=3075532 RepID=UPI00374E1FDC
MPRSLLNAALKPNALAKPTRPATAPTVMPGSRGKSAARASRHRAGAGRFRPGVDRAAAQEDFLRDAGLTGDGHAGQCCELGGPRLMTFGDAVGETARASGRDLRYVPVTAEAYAETVALPADLFAQVGAGRLASLTDDVRRVLGRPPRDFADYARTAAARGAWRT